MKNALKFVMALIVTILLMLAFRALAFTVYTVRGSALEPYFLDGDRLLVNRWSYGLRTGGGGIFRYVRWAGAPVERGELVVFNNPADTIRHIQRREAAAYFCTGVPGDTITVNGTKVEVPGKGRPCRVTDSNARLLCFLYNRYEGRQASVKGGRLTVDGVETRCAMFTKDYYWLSSGRKDGTGGSRSFGLVPENHIIGRAQLLLYSVDHNKPMGNRLRPERRFSVIMPFPKTAAMTP